MKSFKYILNDEEGLHARPARLLVKEAGKLTSKVTIDKDGSRGDAKKIFAVMGLCVKKGDEITVIVEGEEEDSDVSILEKFFKENL
ncbi:MAG TPA: HPr family phosphocarrier protein [Clostridiales bacterium]|nr:HPr family phosphocarrier protein [Clostridiales bacterium]